MWLLLLQKRGCSGCVSFILVSESAVPTSNSFLCWNLKLSSWLLGPAARKLLRLPRALGSFFAPFCGPRISNNNGCNAYKINSCKHLLHSKPSRASSLRAMHTPPLPRLPARRPACGKRGRQLVRDFVGQRFVHHQLCVILFKAFYTSSTLRELMRQTLRTINCCTVIAEPTPPPTTHQPLPHHHRGSCACCLISNTNKFSPPALLLINLLQNIPSPSTKRATSSSLLTSSSSSKQQPRGDSTRRKSRAINRSITTRPWALS